MSAIKFTEEDWQKVVDANKGNKNFKYEENIPQRSGADEYEAAERKVRKEMHDKELKNRAMKNIEREREREREIKEMEASNDKETQEIREMMERGHMNKQRETVKRWDYEDKNPVTGPYINKVKDKIKNIKERAKESDINKFLKETAGNNRDKDLINHGVPLKDIREYNELEKKYKTHLDYDDKEGAKEIKDEIRAKKREINQKVEEDNTAKLKEKIEQKKLQQLLNPKPTYKSSGSGKYREPNLKMGTNLKGISSSVVPRMNPNIGGLSRPNVALGGTSVRGIPLSAPSIQGNRNLSLQNYGDIQLAQQRVQDQRARAEYIAFKRRQQKEERDNFINQIFMQKSRVNAMRGEIPSSNNHGKIIKTPRAGTLKFRNPVGITQGILNNKKIGGGMDNTHIKFNSNLFSAAVPSHGTRKPVAARINRPKQIDVSIPKIQIDILGLKKKKGKR